MTRDIPDDGDDHCSHVLRPRFEPDMLECILHVLSHVKSSEGVETGREARQQQDPPRFSNAPRQLLPPCVLFFLSCQTNTPWPRVKRVYFNHNEQRVLSSVWIKALKHAHRLNHPCSVLQNTGLVRATDPRDSPGGTDLSLVTEE